MAMSDYDTILKTVYLVRHGQSEHNILPVFQAKGAPLSDTGREQASKIAKRASDLKIDTLIASPLPRAKETAQIIGQATGKEPIYSEIFVERKIPTFIQGKPYEDLEANKLWREWDASFYDPEIRVADGENYTDLVTRADEAISFLNLQASETILVVSHGGLIRTIVARVLMGELLTPELLKHFHNIAGIENTGLTVLKYRAGFEDEAKWRLLSYNDHAHLTDLK